MPWRIGLGVIGAVLNAIAFLNFNKFIDGHMPRWFYKMVIKNELMMIALVMIFVAFVVFLIGIFIRRRSATE